MPSPLKGWHKLFCWASDLRRTFSTDVSAFDAGNANGDSGTTTKDEVDFKDISIQEALSILEVRRNDVHELLCLFRTTWMRVKQNIFS